MNRCLPKILCVDDEPQNISLLQAMLIPRGYDVVTAVTGEEALAKIRNERIDICLLDVMLPEMDGFDVCRRIKSEDRAIPVVMITSFTDLDSRIRGIEAGAEDFISKPFDSVEVMARIKMLLHVKSLNDKLEAANIELEAFNFSVSHDLGTPLAIISGYAFLVVERSSDVLDDKSREFLQNIQDSALRMKRLIAALLNFSRISRDEILHEKVDLSRMAHDVSNDLQNLTPDRRITFIIAEGIVAEGDADLLRIVLSNLIGNAWKYNGREEGGVIEFGVTEVAGKVVCFVRDNGEGFDMSHADRLFIPFHRLPGTHGDGHGIGLATVERIIRRHGGRVWAESEAGNGATFLFTLECEAQPCATICRESFA